MGLAEEIGDEGRPACLGYGFPDPAHALIAGPVGGDEGAAEGMGRPAQAALDPGLLADGGGAAGGGAAAGGAAAGAGAGGPAAVGAGGAGVVGGGSLRPVGLVLKF